MTRRLSAWPVLVSLALGAGGCGAAPSTQPAPSSGPITVVPPADPAGVIQLIERVAPAVVNVDTVTGSEVPVSDSEEGASPRVERSVGSGFILRSDGLIVTNHHVVATADSLVVTLNDGRRFPGQVIGTDKVTDLALVRIQAGGLPTLPLAAPGTAQTGQFVVALGSPLGLQKTATWGIISATERAIAQNPRVPYLQTDAPINPGNSGGPLVDLEGRVVGINNAIATEAQGIGFAIPVRTLMRILPQLESRGVASHAWLGVTVATSADGGAEVREITENGPAATALLVGDRILAVDGQTISGAIELIRLVGELSVGERVTLSVVRNGQPISVGVTLAELPRD